MNRCKERKRSLSNVFLNIIKLPKFPRYDFCFSENGLVAYQGCQLLGQSSILGKLGENTQGIETGISILANHIKKIHNHLCSTLGTGVDPPRPVRTMSPFLPFFFYMRASLNSDRREEVHLYPKCLALSFSSRSLSSGETNCQHLINFALSYMAGLTLPAKRGTFVEFR